jgi:hypothetical protein
MSEELLGMIIGAGAVILGAIINNCLNFITEKIKANYDESNFISKTQFDTEFNIYKNLAEYIFHLIDNIRALDREGKPEDNKHYETVIEDNLYKYHASIDSLYFLIPEKFYDKFNELWCSCYDILVDFKNSDISNDIFQTRKKDLFNLNSKIMKDLRLYLYQLKIR